VIVSLFAPSAHAEATAAKQKPTVAPATPSP
jgi:hypothetical protein